MNYETKELIVFLLVAALVVGILLYGAWHVSGYSCVSMWADSGMEVRFGFPEGCQIKNQQGFWIPSRNYREI
jgi:hypothetical protein